MRWIVILVQNRGQVSRTQLLRFGLIVGILAYLHGPRGCLESLAWGAPPRPIEDYAIEPHLSGGGYDAAEQFTEALTKEAQLLELLLACEGALGLSIDLITLQRGLESKSEDEDQEIARAFKRARRASRLPEVFRVQSGARFDRDRENRARLTQDFDALGDMHKSSFEDRDTYQNDLYVDVRLSADWRLTRTRWSGDEVALRRERTSLRAHQADRRRELVQHWFGLQHAHIAWCDALETPDEDFLTPAQERRRTQQVETLRLQLWQHVSALNSLTDGWFVEALTRSLEGPTP